MYRSRYSFLFLLLLVSFSGQSQMVFPTVVTTLPSVLNEVSGIQYENNVIWAHNDSGDLPRIFKLDTLGNMMDTVYLKNTTAVDYEDITTDTFGNFYIGDFGNNANARTNLMIYKINNSLINSSDTVGVDSISFLYPDQTQFPPPTSQQNFDCEAFFHYQNKLYLFTKHNNNSSYTKLYSIPDSAGNYVATLLDSFLLANPVTAADISDDGNSIVLLSYGKIVLFQGVSFPTIFNSNITELIIPITQTEGICFGKSKSELFITDEFAFGLGGNLYELNIQSYLTFLNKVNKNIENTFTFFPNPTKGQITIEWDNEFLKSEATDLKIYTIQGKLIKTHLLVKEQNLDLSYLKKGIYLVKVGGTKIIKRLIIN